MEMNLIFDSSVIKEVTWKETAGEREREQEREKTPRYEKNEGHND